MIAQPLAGSQRPRPSAATSAAAPARNKQAPSHINQAAIGSNAKQPVIDLTEDDRASSSSDRPIKRQKLDHNLRIGAAAVAGGKPYPRDGSESRSPSVASMSRGLATPFPVPSSVRGPPAWSFEDAIASSSTSSLSGGSSAVTSGSSPAQEISTAKQEAPPALPIRPWKHTRPDRQRKGASRIKEDMEDREVRITPYHLSPPSDAPRFKNDKVADFSPWTGSHPEDALTDQTAKQGYYDRIQVSQNESNTARPSLYAQFKHRSGLQVLSSVFAAALEKRQSHCKVTAPSTFKPPPRVTLTDIKREAWLRDLANPSVPLRRLSRTIPHGIRGKVLLEQCLSKSVPMGRAVWLAKCVGANEIRAFKRKGTSGAFALGLETKWVRDWTTNVQQFVDGVVDVCGQPDWKSKITYVVRLAARLFSEHLLDQDHYLEWFLYSLDAASLDKVPIWLLMMGIYWDSLVRYRKRSRRLAEVLLEKLRLAREKGQEEILSPLINRLSPLLRRFMQQHPPSFILPQSWNKFESTITFCLDLDNPAQNSLFENLSNRNKRVQKPKAGHSNAQRSPEQRIIRLLDSTSTNPKYDIPTLATECLKTLKDHCSLVSKVLEWASTSFRQGMARIYVAVRLLRKWKKAGLDIDSHILSFLAQSHSKTGLLMENVYHIISELVRSQTFSTGKYLQWLMARGVVDNMASSGNTPSGDISLLAHLPASRLPEHLWSLRNTLLTRAGLSVSGEVQSVQQVKVSLRGGLPPIFYEDETGGDTEMSDEVELSSLSWTVKSEIGQWIRQGVASHYKDAATPTDEKAASNEVDESALTPEEFYLIRDTLERLGDLSMLADVLNHASNSNDTTVLASAVDTINYHLDSFSVIGAAQDLFKRYVEAYSRLKGTGGPPRELLTSLVDLGVRLPSEAPAVNVLYHNLAQQSKKAGVPASSPVSDHLMETIDHANPTFLEELDQLFSSGDRMDESTMVRIFETLTKGLQTRSGKGFLSACDACRYLAQLRTFNPKHFDSLLLKWIEALLKSPTRPKLSEILVPLVGVGCVSLRPLFVLVKKLSSDASGISDMPALQLNLLHLLGPKALDGDGPLDLVSYRFRLYQKEYVSTHSDDVYGLIQDAIATLPSGHDSDSQDEFNASILPILRDLILRHPDVTNEKCMKALEEKSPASMNAVRQALNHLLGSGSDNVKAQGLSEAVQAIQLANDFSIRFCQLKLRLLCAVESAGETKNNILDIMFKTAVSNVRSGTSHWVDLISILGQDAARQIREKAEEKFLAVALSDSSVTLESTGDLNVEATPEDAAAVYLSIVEELAYSIPEFGVPSVEPVLVDKMNTLLQRTFATDKSSNDSSSMLFWVSTLLRLCVIHFPTLPQTTGPKPGAFDPSRLLIAICCISLSPLLSNPFYSSDTQPNTKPLQNPSSLQTHALDIASSILDSIPDESRHQCIRILRDRLPAPFHVQNDSRLLFLFGPITDSSLPQPPTQQQQQQQPANQSPLPIPTSSTSAPSSTPLPTPTPPKDDNPTSLENRLYLQSRGTLVPYHLRAWEMLGEAAPIVGANDTAVGLGYFGARRSRA